jgi:hypothetical protein
MQHDRRQDAYALGLPTIRIIITGIPVFSYSYSYSTGPSLFEHEYEYHFIEYEYEGSQKVVGRPKAYATFLVYNLVCFLPIVGSETFCAVSRSDRAGRCPRG